MHQADSQYLPRVGVRCGRTLATVRAMANRSSPWFSERRVFGVVAALAAAVIGVVSVADLDTVGAGDVAVVAAGVGSYVVHGAFTRFPAWATFGLACATVVVLNAPDREAESAMFFVVLALAYLALNEPRRLIVLGCGVGALAAAGIGVARETDWTWQYWVIGFAFGWGFGELGYHFRLARDELASTRALIADQAALNERQRIARDVHDVLGHSLIIVMLQLTAARHLLHRDPEKTDAALADAERVARESLNQVRRTLGMLRSGGAASTDDVGVPSPMLDDLDQLLADYRSAGISVRAEVVGSVAALDSSRSMAGYRIVQEALANVSKHAPSAETQVKVEVDAVDGACRIVVDSRGGDRSSRVPSGGFGLVGMRERARSVGGTVEAGPVLDGWRVTAVLPPWDERASVGA